MASANARHRDAFEFPMCTAEERRPKGRSPRALSEPSQRASCAAALSVEYRRAARRAGAPGSPFLWLLSFGEAKESDLQPAAPANLSFFGYFLLAKKEKVTSRRAT